MTAEKRDVRVSGSNDADERGDDAHAFLSLVKTAPPLDDEATWAARDAQIRTEREREQRQGFATRADALEALGFSRRALDVAMAPDTNAAPVRKLRTWKPSMHNIAVLSGVVGCGKTVAAAWWALRTSIRGIRCIRATTFATSSRYTKEARELLQAPALVLDELAAETPDAGGYVLSALDELVDVFYAARRPLIITTNAPWPLFVEKFGARITDRLNEAGHWIDLQDAPSLRTAPRQRELPDPRAGGRR